MQNELLKEQNLGNENKPNAILYDKSKYLFRLDRDFNFKKDDYQVGDTEKSSFDNNIEDNSPFSKINAFELLNSNAQNDVTNQEKNENIVNNNDLCMDKEVNSLEQINVNDIPKENASENSVYVAEPVSNIEQVQPVSNFQENTPSVSVYEDDFAKLAGEKEYNTDTSIVNQEEQPIDTNETANNDDVNLTNILDSKETLEANSLEQINVNDIPMEDVSENSVYVAEPVSNIEQVQSVSNFQENTPSVSVYEDDFAKLAGEKEYNTDTSIVHQEEQPIDTNETANNDINLTNILDNKETLEANSLENTDAAENNVINEVKQGLEQNNSIQEEKMQEIPSINNDTMIYPSITKNDALIEDNTTVLSQDMPTLEEVSNNVSNEININLDSQNDDDVEIFDVNE